MSKTIWVALLCAIIPIFMSSPSYSKDLTPKDVSSFADDLFEDGDYYRAITEYKRLIHYFPDSDFSKEAKLKIPLAYLEGKKYGAAIVGFKAFIKLYPEDPLAPETKMLVADANYRARNYQEASRYFSIAGAGSSSSKIKVRASSGKGWSLIKEGKWEEAHSVFDKSDKTSGHKMYSFLLEDLEGAKELDRKSPALAGTLSAIIPGAGQLYVGRKKDAIVSFLLNGFFIAGTIEAFNQDENTIGTILLFFETGWYMGNIYSAVGGAHKYNRKVRDDFIYGMERKYSLGVNEDGKLLGIYKLRF